MAEREFRALSGLTLSTILSKLDRGDQAACAAVCRSWLLALQERWRKLRVVMRPPESVVPEQALDGPGLRHLLGRFSEITDVRIAGLGAESEVLPPLPPLPKLRALDLESGGLDSLSLSTWQRLGDLTSLSYTETDCDRRAGKEVLLGLPLLQELSITCLSGDLHSFLSKMPDMPALRGFTLKCFDSDETRNSLGNSSDDSIEGSYPWMRYLERLQLRISSAELSLGAALVACQLPEAILGSCPRVQHLALSMENCTVGIIRKAASLKSLRSLQVYAVVAEDCSTSPAASAAWTQLKAKLTALYITFDYYIWVLRAEDMRHPLDLAGLPSTLKALRMPLRLANSDIDAASLAHLVGLRQLHLGSAIPSPVEPLTALQGLTQLELQIQWTVADSVSVGQQENQRQTAYMQLLGALPQLRELVLDLSLEAQWPASLEERLVASICRSSADVDLRLDLVNTDVYTPKAFLSSIRDRLVALRIFFRSQYTGDNFRFGEQLDAVWCLPDLLRLQKLQLRFDFHPGLSGWQTLRRQSQGDLPQLRYICVLYPASLDRESERRVFKALCSAFPNVAEVCVHGDAEITPLSLCSSCSANKMGEYYWM